MEFSPGQQSAYLKAAAICSRSEKCISEVLEKLKAWGLSSEESEVVVKKLAAEKYLDDERFARAFVKDKFRFNHWGRQKIAFILRSKNISTEIMELALEEIEDECYSDELRKILIDKEKSIRAKDELDKRNKLMRFAMGRGFEPGKISAALKELGA